MTSANAPEKATAGGGPFRSRRQAAGLSQQRLAELAGCSLAMLRVLEGGYTPSYSNVLGRIARALDALEDEDPAAQRGLATTSSGTNPRHEHTA